MNQPKAYAHCKPLADALQARGVVVLAFSAGHFAAASYGATKAECRQMAKLLDRIADQLEAGTLPAPELGGNG